MWLLDFLPGWLFHLVLIAGVISIIASQLSKYIPVVNTYRMPVLIAGIFLLAIGIFFEGALYNEDKWKQKIADIEKKVLVSEVESAKANTDIAVKTVEKVKVIKDVQVVIQKEIVESAPVIDTDCRLSAKFIELHNKAASRLDTIK